MIDDKMGSIVQKEAFSICNNLLYLLIIFSGQVILLEAGQNGSFTSNTNQKACKELFQKSTERNAINTRTSDKNHFVEISHHAGCCS